MILHSEWFEYSSNQYVVRININKYVVGTEKIKTPTRNPNQANDLSRWHIFEWMIYMYLKPNKLH